MSPIKKVNSSRILSYFTSSTKKGGSSRILSHFLSHFLTIELHITSSSSRFLSHFLSPIYNEVVVEICLTFCHQLRKLLIVIFVTLLVTNLQRSNSRFLSHFWSPTYKGSSSNFRNTLVNN